MRNALLVAIVCVACVTHSSGKGKFKANSIMQADHLTNFDDGRAFRKLDAEKDRDVICRFPVPYPAERRW